MDRDEAPDAPARAVVEETRAEAEAEKALRAENARLREEMERAAASREAENARLRAVELRRAAERPAPREDATTAAAAPILAELGARAARARARAAVAPAAARAAADAAAAARCDRAFTPGRARGPPGQRRQPRCPAPVAAPTPPAAPAAEPASAQHEFQSRRASLRRVEPSSPSPSPLPEPASEGGLRPSASSSSLEDQIAAGRRNLRKSPPPSPSPAQKNTRKSVESYLAARWRAAATEPDPPREDEAACPLDGGDLGPRLEAFESESVASSTDSSTAASSVERPRSLLSKARAVNGGPRPAPEPAPAPQAPEESSDAGSAEPAEDPAVLAAAQTRLAASEAELAGLLEALAQTRRDVAETRRVVDDESKASVASSIGE